MAGKKTKTQAAETKHNLGKVLVIGGNGFLGHHVVNQLLTTWTAEVSVIDLTCKRNRRPDSDGVQYFEADITDDETMQALFKKISPDVVIHTASPAPQSDSTVGHDLYTKVNIEGTKCVIEACEKADVKALVYTSSASILSDNKNDLINADERWPVIRGEAQTEYYSETKAAAEDLVLKANRKDGSKLLTAAIRPAGIFGEGDTMLTRQMIKIYREGKTGFQVGDNTNLFDFTYVGNISHAHLLAARLLLATYNSKIVPLDTERVDGQAFLVTNDSPIYFWDFARSIWKAAGSDKGVGHVWALPRELGITLGWCSEVFFTIVSKPPTFNRQRIVYSCMTRYYNIAKAKRILGYTPLVDMEEGIARSVNWFLENEQALRSN